MTGFNSKRDAAADKDALFEKFELAQPAQEPVAWITPDGKGFRIRFSAPTNDVPLGWDALYTAPPKREWVKLTYEEIEELFQSAAGADEETVIRFARLIESKIKEKNT